jgi:hypothetical protein
MTTYGYTIINTLVTDIDPDIQAKNAMNRINAADRRTVANLKQKHLELELLQKQRQKQKVNVYKDKVLQIKEERLPED